jgi:energy-coupling factor transporter ATP-binding protein EcfA2
MLRRIEFENFMSLRNVGVNLQPLTVFIGPNGSGKSAIFKGLVVLAKLLNGAPVRGGSKGDFFYEPGVTLDDLVWNGNSGLPIKFRVWFDGNAGPEASYTLELSKRGEGWGVTRERFKTDTGWLEFDEDQPFEHGVERKGPPRSYEAPLRSTLSSLVHRYADDPVARPAIQPILQMAERFGRAYRYRPSAGDIARFVELPKEPGSRVTTRENGFGVAAELQALFQGNKKERETFDAVEADVKKLFPHVRSIGFKSDWQGVRLTYVTDRSEDPIPAPQESDGVLLSTFLFWRLRSGGSSIKVCLEEPENGMHAFLLAERFQALKTFSADMQMLVATHSPEFLRQLSAHPRALWKELRRVEFAAGAGTSVHEITAYPQVTHLIEKYLTDVHERWKPIVEGWTAEADKKAPK